MLVPEWGAFTLPHRLSGANIGTLTLTLPHRLSGANIGTLTLTLTHRLSDAGIGIALHRNLGAAIRVAIPLTA